MTTRHDNSTPIASGRVRLLGAFCCLLLLLPVGTLRSVSMLRIVGTFNESESRPQSEYETVSEVLHEGRPASRRMRDRLAVCHTLLSKREGTQAGAARGRSPCGHAGLASELGKMNGCGAILRC